jgi:nitrite reductase (NADH) large subunit
MRERLVIIGNGMAATRLVRELSKAAPGHFAITIIGDEMHAAYNRVLLSSLLAEDVSESDLALESQDWWREQGVETLRGHRVTQVDTAARQVLLDDGRRLPFDRLVFATGSSAVRLPLPGADLPGVLTFRTIADVHAMQAVAGLGTRAVVIGGGLLGLEAAYGLAKAGADVTVVHVMDRLMERQLDPRAADLLRQELETRGMRVCLLANSESIIGQDHVEGLRLSTGEIIPADLLVMAVGIRPSASLAKEAGLAVNRGILIDDMLRTSDAHIYAIGECAEHRGIAYGLVEPAYEQARVLAQHLAGKAATYEGSLLATNLKVSGVSLFSAGDFLGTEGTQALVFQDRGLGIYKKLVLQQTERGTRLVGCVLYGDTLDGLWYQDLIRSQDSIDRMRHDLIFGRTLAEQQAA